jgi:hypothetical protein
MQFLNALVKGLGWSLGLGLGFMITAIAYQTYEDYRVGGWVDRIETAYPDQVAVSNSDLETLELNLLKQAVMNGSVLISGELKNTLERPLQFAGVAAMIRYEEVTI